MASRESVDSPFGEPTVLGANVNTRDAGAPAVTGDGLTLLFHSKRSMADDRVAVWQSTRGSTDQPFGPAVLLGPNINEPDVDQGPMISADGCVLFFTSRRAGGQGDSDLWTATRPSLLAPFGPAVNWGPKINSPQAESRPTLSLDGRTLYFYSKRPGSHNGFWETHRVPR